MNHFSRYTFLLSLLISVFMGCSGEKPVYDSETFQLWHDRVEQDDFTARAISATHIISDYVSPDAHGVNPHIQFKFSINGRDNENARGIDHQAWIYPEGDETVVLDIVFGQQVIFERPDAPQRTKLPENTHVLFRVDFRHVLQDFEEKGYFEDIHGERIMKEDFKGLYIAGGTHPLNWDFESLTSNPVSKLYDENEDGIYETLLVFNPRDLSQPRGDEWKLQNDIAAYPSFSSHSLLLDAIYNMSLDELEMLKEDDGTFRTGAEWSGVWTRDISYSVLLSLAFLEPEMSMTSLMRKVQNDRIIQDTGTGGAWPVSSDRIVWALAAWEIYKYTGDNEWLENAYRIISNSLMDDQKTVFDHATGLYRGESSFLDWREQTYPEWMEPVDIYASLNLGTNAGYYQALQILSQMAGELDLDNTPWAQKATALGQAINRELWLEDKGYYAQFIYGRNFQSVSPRSETLGESFTILFDIADDQRKKSVLTHTPNVPYGVPCIFPQIPNIPPYHNNGIWPFVQAYWAWAAASQQHTALVEYGYATILRQAALFLTNKENFVAQTGDFAGTQINSDRQQWSVAGQLAMNYRVLFGMGFDTDRLSFQPVIPRSFAGLYTLENFRYREATLNITVSGYGNGIRSFVVNGQARDNHFVAADEQGILNIEIVMNEVDQREPFALVQNHTSPEAPVLQINGPALTWNKIPGAADYHVFHNGIKVATVSDTTYLPNADNAYGEFQVLSLADGYESFLSEPVVALPTGAKHILDAATFNLNAQKSGDGYTGKGYVVFTRQNDAKLKFTVDVPGDGTYTLYFRYANGSGPVNTDNRCAIRSLFVNNEFASSLVFPQRGSDEWSDWGYTHPERYQLTRGQNEFEVRFEPFNENMNLHVNDFWLDQVILEMMME